MFFIFHFKLKATAVGIVKGEDVSTVAVKMAKPPVDKAHLTSLMGEIKIMQHLGKHLNVVNLLGAVTVNLNKRNYHILIIDIKTYKDSYIIKAWKNQ